MFKMVEFFDVSASILDMDLVYLIVIPLVFSIATIWKFWESFMSTDRLRSIVSCFILIVFFQSSTLYPDIHPQISSSVQSHLFKYWFYNKDFLPYKEESEVVLNPFSDNFRQIVLEKNENILNDLPSLSVCQRNVVVIILESFCAYGSDLSFTPNFDRNSE